MSAKIRNVFLKKKVAGLIANRQPLKHEKSDRFGISPAFFCVSEDHVNRLKINPETLNALQEKGIYLGTDHIHDDQNAELQLVHVFDAQKSRDFVKLQTPKTNLPRSLALISDETPSLAR